MTNGVILAGGLATRLGPVFGGESKALIPVGGRPHLVDQVTRLRLARCERVVVVASPATAADVQLLVERAGLTNVSVAVQPSPRGAVNALRWGLRELPPGPIYLLFADTSLDDDVRDFDPVTPVSWIGVAPAPTTRSFCWRNPATGEYEYSNVEAGTPVTVGAYYFTDFELTQQLSVDLESTDDGLASFLTEYASHAETYERELPTWLDVGDVAALRHARRTRFAPRATRQVILDDSDGTVTKFGSGPRFEREVLWLLEMQHRDKPTGVVGLVPRVTSFADGHYTTEFYDLPTLAELWLYRPGRPDVWAQVFRAFLTRLDTDLWQPVGPGAPTQLNDERSVLVEKARIGLQGRPEWYGLVERLLDEVSVLLTPRVDASRRVHAHGNLNFDNVLHSPVSGVVKLLGPHGTSELPQLWEYATLRASYHGGMTAIDHDLYSLEGEHNRERIHVWPERVDEIAALDEVLAERESLNRLAAAEGCLLLIRAGIQSRLSHARRHALVLRGAELLREALS